MIKLLSLFSGIGAFEKALERIGELFETVNYCEIDKYAAKAYSLIHNTEESKNLKDVTKINTDLLPDDLDLITYGFPCQDISLAGKQKGFKNEDGSFTRSGLFFEALRIIEATKPNFAIAENVKALTDKTFETEFQIVLDSLEDAGYKNYYAVLNAKDYGIPQNRERVFIISIRKDIDNGFCFPKSFELKHRLKDLLEDKVDDKYYLSEKVQKRFRLTDYSLQNPIIETPNRLFNIYGYDGGSYAGNVYDQEGLSPALLTMQGGNKQPMIVDYPKIRKLIPKECFRLMGFDDKDCDILEENKISDSQIYKMAGNSIVVDVLEYLFKALFMQYGDQLQIEAEIEPIVLEPMILDFRQITFDDLLDNADSGLLEDD